VDIFQVIIPPKVLRSLNRVPQSIVTKLQEWVDSIGMEGLHKTRKIAGYHDEPVHGKARRGQRSIRLNRSWRAFYRIDEAGIVHFIEIIEVNHHEY
jgi:proteic killer suppression protein